MNERRFFLNRLPGDKIEGVDENSLIWGIFMTSSLHAAIFLGKGYSENLHSIRNTGQKPTVKKLFDATQTLIHEQELEIPGMSELSWCSSKWEELHLTSVTEVMQLMKAKVYVFSFSVLCVGKMSEYLQSNIEWEIFYVFQKYTAIQSIGWTRWEPVEFPPRNPKVDGRIGLYTRIISWKNYVYVDVQRHPLGT